MAKDYKHAARPGKTPPLRRGSRVSFVSGLALGLTVALFTYLWSASLPPPPRFLTPADSEPVVEDLPPDPGSERRAVVELPPPQFDFYKILPEMEVTVPEWELPLGDHSAEQLSPGTYVLQVGSFRRFEEADRAKARLALQGIAATIQRVVINGQQVWFRVHVGPFENSADIRTMRIRLIENDMDFILLRIGNSGTT